jgi:inosine-uridine nucleoside N-ribohydrolase
MKQVEWAAGFRSESLHESGGVDFMRREINAHPGEITLIAVGELTNIAAVLESEAGISKKIRAISLMGGAIYRGYAPASKPEPEWNIRSNAAAARAVFGSGVPLLVAPLDSTTELIVTPEMRVKIFSRGAPLTDALAALNSVWRHTNTWKAENPTLFDLLAVNLVSSRKPYKMASLRIDVSADGFTRPAKEGKANADVAIAADSASVMNEFVELMLH